MSIRPVDFNGMIQNTQEVTQSKTHEDHAPLVQQNNVVAEIANEVEVAATQVHEQEDATAEGEFDTSREGDASGYEVRVRKRAKPKREKVPDGSVTVKSAHKSFDITI